MIELVGAQDILDVLGAGDFAGAKKDADEIETAGATPKVVDGEIGLGRVEEARALPPGQTVGGGAEGTLSARLDLDEDERVAILADEIQLKTPQNDVAAENTQPLGGEQLGGRVLAYSTNVEMPGRHG